MKKIIKISQSHNKVSLRKLILLSVVFFLTSTIVSAQSAKGGKKISPDLFGLFFEDINYSADGGLYAELVQNRSFEYNPTERMEWNPYSYWDYISLGFSYGRISVETSSPIHPNNPHYMVLDVEHIGHEAEYSGESGVGLKNSGFEGIVIHAGEKYNFSIFARQLSGSSISLKVSLQDRKGILLEKIYCQSCSNRK